LRETINLGLNSNDENWTEVVKEVDEDGDGQVKI
jgi:Ca2+-binding EF-hand superfamily protein